MNSLKTIQTYRGSRNTGQIIIRLHHTEEKEKTNYRLRTIARQSSRCKQKLLNIKMTGNTYTNQRLNSH